MRKILLVEDNKLLLTALREGLTSLGYEVETAENGEAGLKKAKEIQNELGVIICDVMMPVMDGFQMLKEIKQDPNLRKLSFIFLTAIGDLDRMDKGRELGATDFLIKDNVDLDRLNELIKRYG